MQGRSSGWIFRQSTGVIDGFSLLLIYTYNSISDYLEFVGSLRDTLDVDDT